ncbi:transcriptional activator protein acu-15, putative [Talaromyces stipitatus ATCC 10500]|uniref:Transcriptional activator protein acu-15, putative n=1 Tax=Talaromyces stipitatus (strain ATCC 10500 / CBS 375.48 / QM 6759 / NRRL 1006) TaxID=441959 RepID=B8MR73_TALSN|nr:transcriptional activator protein acu-15, putative [Talaromyces stipitatus ATCC 10500]EED12968.1 transcriptional activator protein acu-15, putative [Talaromyces stipitatus ATCC 10500]
MELRDVLTVSVLDPVICLVEDPVTRTYRPRNYVESLEKRVAHLENLLKQRRPDIANSDLPPHDRNQPASCTSKNDSINEDNDGLENLASKVGLLSLSAAGAEPQYLGTSSIFAFSRLINSTLRQVVSPDLPAVNSLDASGNRSCLLPSPCLLPDYDSAVQLSDVYFQNVNTHYPFLHEATFRAWESMLIMDESVGIGNCHPNSVSLFFLNMVYAVGALLLPNLGYSAESLYMSALMYIDDILAYDNLEAVQAILCCAIYSVRSPTGTSHWKLAGLALRQCIDLGYHRNTKHFPPFGDVLGVELRKRVFWCAYVLETQAAVMLGRPLGIPYQEVDAEYPIDIDDLCIRDNELIGTPRTSPADAPNNMTRAIHTFRIRRLLNRIYTHLYSKPDPRCVGKHDRQRDIRGIRAEIENWRTETPPTPSHTNEELVLFTTEDWYDLEYYYTILQLYRGQIIDYRTDTPDSVFLECLGAAESICQRYRRQFLGKRTSCTWTALHELFLAGLTYLHCLWASSAARNACGYRRANTTCNDCIITLVIIAERWDAAAPYREIFMVLANRTISMMSGRVIESASTNMTSSYPGGGDEEDLTVWLGMVADAGVLHGYNGLFDRSKQIVVP